MAELLNPNSAAPAAFDGSFHTEAIVLTLEPLIFNDGFYLRYAFERAMDREGELIAKIPIQGHCDRVTAALLRRQRRISSALALPLRGAVDSHRAGGCGVRYGHGNPMQ